MVGIRQRLVSNTVDGQNGWRVPQRTAAAQKRNASRNRQRLTLCNVQSPTTTAVDHNNTGVPSEAYVAVCDECSQGTKGSLQPLCSRQLLSLQETVVAVHDLVKQASKCPESSISSSSSSAQHAYAMVPLTLASA